MHTIQSCGMKKPAIEYTESFSLDQKKEIAKSIKNITEEQIKKEFIELNLIGAEAHTKSERCRIGNNIVDYFTFPQRLETRGKYDVNYFEFIKIVNKYQNSLSSSSSYSSIVEDPPQYI